MKTFFALAVALFTVSANAAVDFETCTGFDNTPFVSSFVLQVKPDPIVAKEGQEVRIHFNAEIVKTLPAGSTIDVKLIKEGIPLPCLPLPGLPIKVGSCKYEAQELLDLIPKDECDTFAPKGQACTLPLNPGYYGDKDPNGAAVHVLPEIPAILKPLIKGDISVKAMAYDASGAEILCTQNTLSVVV